jgi:glycosyltransferase involved in cell wall biosynthesis
MPAVTVLIPAYKPEHLELALMSAQRQTFQDIEILVGDDTPDARLEAIVQRLGDPRIRYIHHGFQDSLKNARELLRHAKGQYIKWLYDDDFLLPGSVEALLLALQMHPRAALAFHERQFIDANNATVFTPAPLLQPGTVALVDRPFLVNNMVGKIHNFVGEPSNIMFNQEIVDPMTLSTYRSAQMDFLNDVAMYLNASKDFPLVAVGGYLSKFRQHEAQNSNKNSPGFSAGLYEWEVFIRGEAADGNLSSAALHDAQNRLKNLYVEHGSHLPEITKLLSNLDEIIQAPPNTLFSSERFQEDYACARKAVAARLEAKRKSSQDHSFCVICQSPVEQWVPHPNASLLWTSFISSMEVIGSRLDKHLCPRCHCNDRERHLWLYLQAAGFFDQIKNMRILHIAPEPQLESKIRKLNPLEYVTGDLFPRSPLHSKINVEKLDFPDDHFDFIICNHVLEHVNSPEVALAEFRRCLTFNGHLVAQTPYSPVLRYTFELNKPATSEFATHYYGQDDHVRLFGADILNKFHAAGLNGDLYPHTTVLGDLDAETYGCNSREPFFFFSKGKAPMFS